MASSEVNEKHGKRRGSKEKRRGSQEKRKKKQMTTKVSLHAKSVFILIFMIVKLEINILKS